MDDGSNAPYTCPCCKRPGYTNLDPAILALKPVKTINKATHVPLSHVYDDKLNAHMGVMNVDGWELINIFIEAIGIEERCIMIWGKKVSCP
jgi:hypothetical protein